jgi:excisionase family DNA binding protein
MQKSELVNVAVSPEIASIIIALMPQPEPEPEPDVPAPAKPAKAPVGRLLRISEAAELLGCSSVTCRRMVRAGQLTAILLNKYPRVREAEVVALINGAQ